MAGFEDLLVWQRSVELSVAIYRGTSEIQDFGFRNQITRAGLSTASNIAEGMERTTIPGQCRFLDYARGSCGEVRTQTIVGGKVGFLSAETTTAWKDETKQISAMIQGLIRSLQKNRRD